MGSGRVRKISLDRENRRKIGRRRFRETQRDTHIERGEARDNEIHRKEGRESEKQGDYRRDQ